MKDKTSVVAAVRRWTETCCGEANGAACMECRGIKFAAMRFQPYIGNLDATYCARICNQFMIQNRPVTGTVTICDKRGRGRIVTQRRFDSLDEAAIWAADLLHELKGTPQPADAELLTEELETKHARIRDRAV